MSALLEIHTSRQLAGRVVRWHTWPMIRRPTTAEHCARVATIYCELWGIPRGEVLYFILHHDNGEFLAGDVPFGSKRLSPELAAGVNAVEKEGLRRLRVTLPKLSDHEFTQFKCADLLEMYETAEVELNMGNQYARAPLDNCIKGAVELAHSIGKHHIIGSWLNNGYRADADIVKGEEQCMS